MGTEVPHSQCVAASAPSLGHGGWPSFTGALLTNWDLLSSRGRDKRENGSLHSWPNSCYLHSALKPTDKTFERHERLSLPVYHSLWFLPAITNAGDSFQQWQVQPCRKDSQPNASLPLTQSTLILSPPWHRSPSMLAWAALSCTRSKFASQHQLGSGFLLLLLLSSYTPFFLISPQHDTRASILPVASSHLSGPAPGSAVFALRGSHEWQSQLCAGHK